MQYFRCDYQEGAHPLIMNRLAATNFVQVDGYGEEWTGRGLGTPLRVQPAISAWRT
ncbi:MAG: hypothetical protein IJ795_05935 [Bacteroidales bacterium]|nr:hypothetical protein [Bacteroidales bacterium]